MPKNFDYISDRTYHLEDFADRGLPRSTKFHEDDTIPHDGKRWLVVRSSGAFHLRLARASGGTPTHYQAFTPKAHGYAYRPPHPSMTFEDCEGATYAWDDGTYWHFAHCSPHEQVDLAVEYRNFTVAQFTGAIEDATIKVHEATNNPVKAFAVGKVRAIIAFAEAAAADAYNRVIGETLGHFHRNPHQDHARDIALAAIQATLDDWNTRGVSDKAVRTDAGYVQATVAAIRVALQTEHVIEWRGAREKRLNDAAAAKGTDPVAGFEYVYTSVATAAVITGDANLPDPAWEFDKLRAGPVVRGDYSYRDGEPTATIPLPWIIRFKRPIPEGTAAGADIGSVAWEQETAYSPGS